MRGEGEYPLPHDFILCVFSRKEKSPFYLVCKENYWLGFSIIQIVPKEFSFHGKRPGFALKSLQNGLNYFDGYTFLENNSNSSL